MPDEPRTLELDGPIWCPVCRAELVTRGTASVWVCEGCNLPVRLGVAALRAAMDRRLHPDVLAAITPAEGIMADGPG